jgi:hypothetical protein
MHRIICDINLKTVYSDGRAELVALYCGKASTSKKTKNRLENSLSK